MPDSDSPRDPAAALALQEAISNISMRCFNATWAMDCNVALWRIIVDGHESHLGEGIVMAEDIERLRELSRKARGWMDWPRGAAEPLFYTFGAWTRLLAKHDADHAARVARQLAK